LWDRNHGLKKSTTSLKKKKTGKGSHDKIVIEEKTI
jgi:hypothetical protein